MALEKVGNLGQIALLQRLLAKKHMNSYDNSSITTADEKYEEIESDLQDFMDNNNCFPIIISQKELMEVEGALQDFEYVVRNLCLNENSLRDKQFSGLLKVLGDLKAKDYY